MKPRTERPASAPVRRANAPGLYACPCCGETLSGPAALYGPCPYRVPSIHEIQAMRPMSAPAAAHVRQAWAEALEAA